VYAGELATTFGTPYQARLRVRFQLRHRGCVPPTKLVPAQRTRHLVAPNGLVTGAKLVSLPGSGKRA
jgi:hypothetical protein